MLMKGTGDLFEFRKFSYFKGIKKRNIWILLALVLVYALVTGTLFFFLNRTNGDIYEEYFYKMLPGYIASETVLSDDSYYLIDQEATDELIKSQRDQIPPIFSNNLEVCYKTLEQAGQLSSGLRGNEEDFIQLCAQMGISSELATVSYDELAHISNITSGFLTQLAQTVLNAGYYDENELTKEASDFDQILVVMDFENIDDFPYSSIDLENCLTKDSIESYLIARLEASSSSFLLDEQIRVLARLVSNICIPNMQYNEIMTLKIKSKINESNTLVSFHLTEGEIIVEENTIVTEEDSRILELLSFNKFPVSIMKLVGNILFMVLVATVALLLLDYYLKDNLHKFHIILISLCGLIITSIVSFFSYRIYLAISIPSVELVLPIFFIPLLVTLLANKTNIGCIVATIMSLSFCLIPGANYLTFFYSEICSLGCLFCVRFCNRRRDLIIQWIFVYLLNIICAIICLLIVKTSLNNFISCMVDCLINVVATFVLLSFSLPLLEDWFNIPTLFKLRELSDTKSAILVRLQQEAPGTYSHSMAVADIAETAARVVGANSALVRVGALYHDIGKMDHAEYFTENSSLLGGQQSLHENLNNNLSTAIIRSHVKLGVEKGNQIHLPQEVLDIIENHHGNDVVTYFYNLALKNYQDNPKQYSEPKVEEYAYLGNPPQNPEEAIVMLSDCSEAAVRSLKKPTPRQIEKMISMILVKKIAAKQFNSCKMTLNDLNKVVKSLSESLTGRYHSRIEYPDVDKKKDAKNE